MNLFGKEFNHLDFFKPEFDKLTSLLKTMAIDQHFANAVKLSMIVSLAVNL